jgi:DNA repair protein RadD
MTIDLSRFGPLPRPYQEAAILELRARFGRGRRAVVLALPTGGGKTVIFALITALAFAKGSQVLIVVHRRELIKQASDKLKAAGVAHGIIAPGFTPDPDALVQVGSVQTLALRLGKLPKYDLIILDEAHHVRAGQWRRLLDAQPQARLLGVTATPARLDGKGLGLEHGGVFDDLVNGASMRELIEAGYLSPCRIFAPPNAVDLRGVHTRGGDFVASEMEARVSTARITGDAVKHYQEHADHQAAIAFCVSIKHAKEVAERFRAAGYRSVCAHGKMPKAERDAAIAGLGNGKIEVLTTCDLISEGLDVPAVGAVILLRPTQSLVLYMQQIGRGMRPAPGKSALIVLDHVGNVARHGIPDLERNWTLAGVQPAQAAPPPRESTGQGRPRPDIEEDDRWLAEIPADRLAAIRGMPYHVVRNAKLTRTELRAYADHHGYRPGWIWHRLREQRAASEAP